MEEQPQVSLVIPVFNEARTIAALIATIKNQSFPPSEVILVDGASTDNTVQLIKKLTVGDSYFHVVEAGRSMPGRGRNKGVERARSEWIAFTDAGISLDKDWLKIMVAAAKENREIGIVYGNYSPQLNSFFDKCAAISYVAPLRKEKIRSTFIASCLMKKKVWEQVGGFPDWRATEDIVFMEEAEKTECKIVTAPGAMVSWQLRPDLTSTFKRFDLYSKYNVWAGRQAYWHYGLARHYAFLIIPILLAIFHSWYWILLVPLFFIARTAKRIGLHRYEFGSKILLNPAVFFMVTVISLVIDAATFTGWIKALSNKNGLYTTVSNA